MTAPIDQEPIAREIARILCVLDSPRIWTCGQTDADNWAHPTPIVSGDGLEFSFSEDKVKGRWHIRFDYDSSLSKYIYRHGPNADQEVTSITCAKSKTPAQLAHDIHRRMVADARKLRAVLLHRRRDDLNEIEAAHRMALELIAASDGYMEIIDRHDPYNSNSEISLYMNRGSNGPYLNAKISQYNNSVSFERFQLPHELAKQVIGVIAEYLKTKGAA